MEIIIYIQACDSKHTAKHIVAAQSHIFAEVCVQPFFLIEAQLNITLYYFQVYSIMIRCL